MTKVEATKITSWLATLYDVPAWTDERMRAFRDAIMDLEYAAAQRAAERYVKTQTKRPQPSDIRELVVRDVLALPGPEEAWGELHEKLQRHSEFPEFSHEAIPEALRLTGRSWKDCRYLQYAQYPWLKRDFQNAYNELADRLQSGGQIEPNRIGRDEARRLLDQIHAGIKKLEGPKP